MTIITFETAAKEIIKAAMKANADGNEETYQALLALKGDEQDDWLWLHSGELGDAFRDYVAERLGGEGIDLS